MDVSESPSLAEVVGREMEKECPLPLLNWYATSNPWHAAWGPLQLIALQNVVVINDQRRMIREALFFVNSRARGRRRDARRRNLIIDAPSHILGPGLAAI